MAFDDGQHHRCLQQSVGCILPEIPCMPFVSD